MSGQKLFKEMGEIDSKYLVEIDNQVIKSIKCRKVFLFASLFCLMGAIISIGAIASKRHNNQSNVSISSTQKIYTDYGSLRKAVKELNFEPKFLEEYSNGMLFSEGQMLSIDDVGNKNKVIARFPMVMISYCLENREVILHCEPLDEEDMAPQNNVNIVEYNGHELYVYSGKVLLVSQNTSDDELKTILTNKQYRGAVLVRNDSVLQPTTRYESKVFWVEKGVLYTLVNLVDNEKDLVEEFEMVTMVREIIN